MRGKKAVVVSSLDQLGKIMQVLPQDPAEDQPVNAAGSNGNGNGNGRKKSVITNELPEVPELPGDDASELSATKNVDYRAVVEGRRQRQREFDKRRDAWADWVKTRLIRLDEIIRQADGDEEILAEADQEIAELKDDLEKALSNVNSVVRRVAWVTLLTQALSKDFSNWKELEEALGKLIAEERLVLCEPGANGIVVYKKTYAIALESLESSDYAEVRNLLADKVDQIRAKEAKDRQAQARDLVSQATISFADARKGKQGKFYVYVPPGEVESPNGPKWQYGGGVLFHSDGERAHPLEGVGGTALAMRIAKDLGAFLPFYMLDWNVPPSLRNIDEALGKSRRQIWFYLTRVIDHAARQAQRVNEVSRQHEDLLGRATVSQEDFLLRDTVGVAVVVLPRWEVRDENRNVVQVIRNLLLLLERRDNGTIVVLDIQATDSLHEQFASLQKEVEYAVSGEKFAGLPHLLAAILRAAYGIAFKASQINS